MLNIDLKGKTAFIAGIGDDQGYGWAIAKALCEAGATVLAGTWAPILNIFQTSLKNGKFDESRKLSNGKMLEIAKIYPIDAAFDTPEDVPREIKENKRYKNLSGYTLQQAAARVEKDYGKIDILVHALANAPEVQKPLLETSRKGYLAALSASSYSFIGLLKFFGPIMNKGGSFLGLTYEASIKAVPGYGGGMSSAKAALESDARTLAFEAGRKWELRVNCISAGPLKSRAAKAIGMIDYIIEYSKANAPLKGKELTAKEVASTAAFLLSDLSSAITGSVVFVDNGLNIMGLASDSSSLKGFIE